MASDTPLFAAMEILKNGLVFLYSRRWRALLGYVESRNPILWADAVALVVLAPAPFYVLDGKPCDFRWLAEGLRAGLTALVAEERDAGLGFDFRFEQFPGDFEWRTDGDPRDSMAGRTPL